MTSQYKQCSHCVNNPPNLILPEEEYCVVCLALRDDDYEIQLYEFYRDSEGEDT